MINISIIICTKDRHKDLLRCIESLNNQSYPSKELIIIDSGENQKLDIDKYNNKYNNRYNNRYNNYLKIKYIRYISSLTVARNMGIRHSEGDVILFLDDDVILDENYIYNIIQIFENYKNVGCVCGDIVSDIVRSDRFPRLIEYTYVKKLEILFLIYSF